MSDQENQQQSQTHNPGRYLALCHALQSGVATELGHDPSSGTPKHLRTGLNIVMRDLGSLTNLLVSKGIIGEKELWEALEAGMEQEVRSYEHRLSEQLGVTVVLA